MLSACFPGENVAFAKGVVPTLKARVDTVPLSATETLALSSAATKIQANAKDHADLMASIPGGIAKKIEANQQELDALRAAVLAVEAEIAIEHPGYHFDETKGQIVKDALPAAAKTDSKAEVK